jgi:hypothetical protein
VHDEHFVEGKSCSRAGEIDLGGLADVLAGIDEDNGSGAAPAEKRRRALRGGQDS